MIGSMAAKGKADLHFVIRQATSVFPILIKFPSCMYGLTLNNRVISTNPAARYAALVGVGIACGASEKLPGRWFWNV